MSLVRIDTSDTSKKRHKKIYLTEGRAGVVIFKNSKKILSKKIVKLIIYGNLPK